MPPSYNPNRAFQPARLVDVHAELLQSLQDRRRQARSELVSQNRARSARLPPPDDEEMAYFEHDEM